MKIVIFTLICCVSGAICLSARAHPVDEEECRELDSGTSWQNRTKVIWNSCLITSFHGATLEEAIEGCKQFANGYLVKLNSAQKENDFRSVLAEWGATDTWRYWVSTWKSGKPSVFYGTSGPRRADYPRAATVCQYEFEMCIETRKNCARQGQRICKDEYTTALTETGEKTTKSVTVSGRTCQRWDSQSPTRHSFPPANHSYCRNTEWDRGPWCFTTDPGVVWEYCYEDCDGTAIEEMAVRYEFRERKKSWSDAEAACMELGGHLASIHDLEQNQQIISEIRNLGDWQSHLWIGAQATVRDEMSHHEFSWSDGTGWDFQHWADGEPSYWKKHRYHEESLCAELYKQDFVWYDYQCSDERAFVCGIPTKPN